MPSVSTGGGYEDIALLFGLVMLGVFVWEWRFQDNISSLPVKLLLVPAGICLLCWGLQIGDAVDFGSGWFAVWVVSFLTATPYLVFLLNERASGRK